MSKITYKDLFALLDEMDRGAKDKSRTIADISNSTVKSFIKSEANMAISAGVTTALIATSGVITGSAIGIIGGAGTGIISSSLTTLGVSALTATGGAAAGGAAGSVVPIVGTIAGAAVGGLIGIFIGNRMKQKALEEKERLKQEVIEKQNTTIRDLEKELNELRRKYGKPVEQNERYKYIIGILMANEELKKST